MTEERQLLTATIAGDTAAFELIVRKYQNLVCAITFGGTGRIEASEELAQEAFFNAWRNLRNLKDLERFRPWLCEIARNLVRNYHRGRKPEISLPDDHIDVVDSDNNPSEKAVSREETMILEQALNCIPAEYREPLVLFYRQGHSIRQVAEGLELNEATVKTRIHRGRQMLKEQTAALVERTLERTVPNARFTKAVMTGIGAGLAAGVAGTASAAAATVGATGATGSSVLSTATGLLSTLAGKIVVAAATVMVTAGVAVYTYQNSQEDHSQQAITSERDSKTNIQSQPEMPNTAVQEQEFVKTSHQEDETDSQAVPQNTEAASRVETIQDLPPARHPDWPKLNEPVDNIYMKMSDNEMWIQLPRRFREEDARMILIDNAKERIEANKMDKTIQYAATKTKQDPPVHRYNQPLTSLEAVRFSSLFRRPSVPPSGSGYTVREIGQEDNGAVLIYSMQSGGLEDSDYEATAYVDAGTGLPEKNSCGQYRSQLFDEWPDYR
ncbi:MAG: sigma-70 family RNA polymerase sigma factor [Phycisphaerae bacterium]|nr:sigma-70 family RNA polymerase sigma factor [Phycisphaerae bacterium]